MDQKDESNHELRLGGDSDSGTRGTACSQCQLASRRRTSRPRIQFPMKATYWSRNAETLSKIATAVIRRKSLLHYYFIDEHFHET